MHTHLFPKYKPLLFINYILIIYRHAAAIHPRQPRFAAVACCAGQPFIPYRSNVCVGSRLKSAGGRNCPLLRFIPRRSDSILVRMRRVHYYGSLPSLRKLPRRPVLGRQIGTVFGQPAGQLSTTRPRPPAQQAWPGCYCKNLGNKIYRKRKNDQIGDAKWAWSPHHAERWHKRAVAGHEKWGNLTP